MPHEHTREVPAYQPEPPRPPPKRNRNWLYGAVAAVAAVALASGAYAYTHSEAGTPEPAAAVTAAPQPSTGTKTVTAPAAAPVIINNNPVPSNAAPPANPYYGAGQFPAYEADIANAGIVAPTGWLDTTGEQLCTDWANGETTANTDPILLAGGIYAYHLATFDTITNNDLCPGVTD
jgi:hypothetical protein